MPESSSAHLEDLTRHRAVDHEVVKATDRCAVPESVSRWRDQYSWKLRWRGELLKKPRLHFEVTCDDPQPCASLNFPAQSFQQLLPLLRVVKVDTEHHEPLHDRYPCHGEPPLMRLHLLTLPAARRPHPFQPAPSAWAHRNESAFRRGCVCLFVCLFLCFFVCSGCLVVWLFSWLWCVWLVVCFCV